ncbi:MULTISPECIES: copper transporter [unclassified Corynebacterium]|uniref:copper transporter n=1 Tax=unclassified Corynebacterium TaxID=2624378 RepID=UPI0029CA6759|nr:MULTISPECIES: copper transporter [unclassified Corynebacterium]WPF67129.1 copper transporter [Corynebacterium sp. 22KM0430]WPF69617.1 copper transporter [Corynebacterium sp. 21KM1197]
MAKAGLVIAGLGFGVALGSALGAYVLAPVDHTDDKAVAAAEADAQRSAEEARASNDVVGSLAPAALAGSLDQRPVLIFATNDAAERAVAVRDWLNQAGAIDAGQINLESRFTDQEGADSLKTIVTNTLPAGAQLSENSLDPGTHAGEALGSALMLNPETGEPQSTVDERADLLTALRDAGFLSYASGTILPAQGIVVLSGHEEGFAEHSLESFAAALHTRGNAVTRASDPDSVSEQVSVVLRLRDMLS